MLAVRNYFFIINCINGTGPSPFQGGFLVSLVRPDFREPVRAGSALLFGRQGHML